MLGGGDDRWVHTPPYPWIGVGMGGDHVLSGQVVLYVPLVEHQILPECIVIVDDQSHPSKQQQ